MPKNILVKLAKNTRRYRRQQGLTQADLAKKINYHPGYISKLEHAKVNVFVSVLFKLANALGIKAKDLIK